MYNYMANIVLNELQSLGEVSKKNDNKEQQKLFKPHPVYKIVISNSNFLANVFHSLVNSKMKISELHVESLMFTTDKTIHSD